MAFSLWTIVDCWFLIAAIPDFGMGLYSTLSVKGKNEKPCCDLVASRFFDMNRAGYFLLFLAFLAFLTGLHPQVLHMVLTSFRGKNI